MKFYILIIATVLLAACTQGEPQISKRQMRQIDKLVEYKLDSFQQAQQQICYEKVLEIASVKADSVITIFEMEAKVDTLNRPNKPTRPDKPEVVIPEFEE